MRGEDSKIYGVVLDASYQSPSKESAANSLDSESKVPLNEDVTHVVAREIQEHKGLSLEDAYNRVHMAINGDSVPLSIAHDHDYAIASCVYQAPT